jgi:hypothetical protein
VTEQERAIVQPEVGKVYEVATRRFGTVRCLVLSVGEFVEVELRGVMHGASRDYVYGERRGLRREWCSSWREVKGD